MLSHHIPAADFAREGGYALGSTRRFYIALYEIADICRIYRFLTTPIPSLRASFVPEYGVGVLLGFILHTEIRLPDAFLACDLFGFR